MRELSIISINKMIMKLLIKSTNYFIILLLLDKNKRMKKDKKDSHTGTRTRVAEVKTRYPNRLDYMGPVIDLSVLYLRECFSNQNEHLLNEQESNTKLYLK